MDTVPSAQSAGSWGVIALGLLPFAGWGVVDLASTLYPRTAPGPSPDLVWPLIWSMVGLGALLCAWIVWRARGRGLAPFLAVFCGGLFALQCLFTGAMLDHTMMWP